MFDESSELSARFFFLLEEGLGYGLVVPFPAYGFAALVSHNENLNSLNSESTPATPPAPALAPILALASADPGPSPNSNASPGPSPSPRAPAQAPTVGPSAPSATRERFTPRLVLPSTATKQKTKYEPVEPQIYSFLFI